MFLLAAGIAGFILTTAILVYVAYLVGVERTTTKWYAQYSKLYRACLIELMQAYSNEGHITKKHVEQKLPKPPSKSGSNILKFTPRKDNSDDKDRRE